MALKTFRPLTPSLRFTELSGFGELNARQRSGQAPHRGAQEIRRSQQPRPHHFASYRWRPQAALTASSISSATNSASAPWLSPSSTIPIAPPTSPSSKYTDGEQRYIIAPVGLAVGTKLASGPEAEPIVGNALPLDRIPLGAAIHNIEIIPGRGAQIGRTAGSSATRHVARRRLRPGPASFR